jgi:hypothetical protein
MADIRRTADAGSGDACVRAELAAPVGYNEPFDCRGHACCRSHHASSCRATEASCSCAASRGEVSGRFSGIGGRLHSYRRGEVRSIHQATRRMPNRVHAIGQIFPKDGLRAPLTSVLEDGVVVRIFFLDSVRPQGRTWMWASGHNGDIKRAAHGYEPTREDQWLRSPGRGGGTFHEGMFPDISPLHSSECVRTCAREGDGVRKELAQKLEGHARLHARHRSRRDISGCRNVPYANVCRSPGLPYQLNCPPAPRQRQAHPRCSRAILSNSESGVLRSY